MSGAELIAVISLGASIVQVIDACTKVVERIQSFRENIVFEDLTAQLALFTTDLKYIEEASIRSTASTVVQSEAALRRVLEGCHRQLLLLNELIEKVSPPGNASKIRKSLTAVRSFGKDTKIRQITQVLAEYRSVLTLHISRLARDQTRDKAVNQRLQLLSTVPFAKDEKFVERTGIYKKLQSVFDSSAYHRRAALYGLGGVGKTQLAIEYSFKSQNVNPDMAVFWIYAGDVTRVLQSFRDIAIKLNLPGQDDPKTNVAAVVRRWLDDESNGPWMVILDNLDDIDVVEQFHPNLQDMNPESGVERRRLLDYIPQRPHGKVLVTSRDRSAACIAVGDNDRLILVDRMDEAESLELLKTKVSVNATDLEDAKLLVKLLDYIPLAITQAGAYLREQTLTMDIVDYCAEFGTRELDQAALLNEGTKDSRRDYSVHNSVMVTWEISFQLIQRRQSRAADLLSLLAMFNRESIPEELVKIENRLEFRRAVSLLENFSFVRITKEPDRLLFSLHRLVQLATQKWLEKNDFEGYWKAQAIDKIAALFSFRAYERWEECDRLLPHAEKVAEYRTGVKETELQRGLVISKIAWHCISSGIFGAAVARAEECMRIYKQYLQVGDEQMLGGKAILALTYRTQGRWDDAEALQVEVMETSKKKLGVEHPDTLASMTNLASTYWNQGRWDDAEELEMRLMETSKRKLGVDHPSTLTSMNNLASTYYRQGRWDDAEALQVEVMETSTKKLGVDHPSTLISMGSLASTYWSQGRWDDAEALEVEVMETRKKKLGVDHPDTLTSMGNLASTYRDQGRWDDAEALEVGVMKTRKKKLGVDHPDTLTSMANLASTYRNQGRWDDAEALEVEVMETSKKKLGVEHPDTLTSMANLASTYRNQGRWDDAEELEVRVMEMRKTKLGVDHPSTLTSIANLASTYRNQGRWDDAEALEVRVMETRKTKLGVDHPSTLNSMANLAFTLKYSGRIAEAIKLMQEAADRSLLKLGINHPDRIARTSSLYEWKSEQGNLQSTKET